MSSPLRAFRLLTVLALTLAATLSAQSRGRGGVSSGNQRADAPRPMMSERPAPAPSMAAGLGSSDGSSPSRIMGGSPGQAPRPNVDGRPFDMPPPASRQLLVPRPLPRAERRPERDFWRGRDLFAEIQMMARRGFLPVTPVDVMTTTITDFAWFPSGWRAYGFPVPANENLHVRLHHSNEGWFRLMTVNRWGQTGLGMLQNLIPTGNPEVTFKNLAKGPQVVYVIVDDPGWMSSKANPFTLEIKRSWDPAKVALPPVPVVLGIWAQHKAAPPEPTPAPTPAATPEPTPAATPEPAKAGGA